MLKLGETYTTFEQCSHLSDIFFDRVNQRICTVRGNGEMGVTAKGFEKENIVSFRVQDKGKIIVVCFSTDLKIACICRTEKTMDLIFLDPKTPNSVLPEVSQNCKSKEAKILGVEWVSDKHFICITDQGLELYQVDTRRKSIKSLRSLSLPIGWYSYYPPSQLLICSSGIDGSVLNPFLIQNGMIHRLCKFEVDFGCSSNRSMLYERDITVASLYEKLFIMVIKSNSDATIVEQLHLYELTPDPAQAAKLIHTLVLNLDGLVAMHVIDNLVIVHHKLTANSYIFDLAVDKASTEHHPLTITAIEISERLFDTYSTNTSQYFPGWYIFSPNLVVDPRFGIFSKLDLIIEPAQRFIVDKFKLLHFIMNRSKAESILMETLRIYFEGKKLKIVQIGPIFQQILALDGTSSNMATHQEYSSKYSLIPVPFVPIKVDQDTIIQNMFIPLRENPEVDKKYLSDVILEFLLVVKQKNATPVHYLPEFIVKVLVETSQYNRLKQLLQYRVIEDSKFLAFELIDLGEAHPPLLQLAIDIPARKGSFDDIIGVLLTKGKVIEAMRCATNQSISKTNAMKFLEVAWSKNDRQIKYTVFTFLQEKAPKFFDNPTGVVEKYVKEFKTLFDIEEIEEAEHRFRLAKISTSPVPISRSVQSEEIPIPDMNSLVNDHCGSVPTNFRIGS